MVIDCGVADRKSTGDKICLVDHKKIKSLVESNAYSHELSNYVKDKEKYTIPGSPSFKVSVEEKANIMTISHETTKVDQGRRLLLILHSLLQEHSLGLIESWKKDYQNKIETASKDVSDLNSSIKRVKKDIAAIPTDKAKQEKELLLKIDRTVDVKNVNQNIINELKRRVNYLYYEIKVINNDISLLKQERNKLLLDRKENDYAMSVVAFSNTIQKNQQYLNNVRKEIIEINQTIDKLLLEEKNIADKIAKLKDNIKNIDDQMIAKENILNRKMEGIEEKIELKSKEIEALELKMKNIQNIQILQPPVRTKYPINRKTKRNVMLAAATGLFMMLFLAFFLEYLFKHRKDNPHEDAGLETEEIQLSLIPRKTAGNL
jgi:hypothetical protein